MNCINGAVCVLALLIGVSSFAEAEESSRQGPYWQVAFAMQWPTGDVKDAFNEFGTSTNYLGGALAGGYFLTDWLAVQARLQVIDQRLSVVVNEAKGLTGTSLAILSAAEVKLYPFNFTGSHGWLQPYSIVGMGAQTSTVTGGSGDSKTGFLLELGVGADIVFGSKFGAFIEFDYQFVTRDRSSEVFDNVSQIGLMAGLTYRY